MNFKSHFVRGNLIFLFFVAFMAGAISKRSVGYHLYIGYDDPQVAVQRGELYDLDKIEQKLIKKSISEDQSLEQK